MGAEEADHVHDLAPDITHAYEYRGPLIRSVLMISICTISILGSHIPCRIPYPTTSNYVSNHSKSNYVSNHSKSIISFYQERYD